MHRNSGRPFKNHWRHSSSILLESFGLSTSRHFLFPDKACPRGPYLSWRIGGWCPPPPRGSAARVLSAGAERRRFRKVLLRFLWIILKFPRRFDEGSASREKTQWVDPQDSAKVPRRFRKVPPKEKWHSGWFHMVPRRFRKGSARFRRRGKSGSSRFRKGSVCFYGFVTLCHWPPREVLRKFSRRTTFFS